MSENSSFITLKKTDIDSLYFTIIITYIKGEIGSLTLPRNFSCCIMNVFTVLLTSYIEIE